jgi:CRP-like cAMP-binding protein
MTAKEARRSPFANIITRSVGRHQSVQVDTLFVELMAGDQFLLCSDGFHDYLKHDAELASLSLTHAAVELPHKCITLANRRGGKDNITVLAVQVEHTPASLVEPDMTVSRKAEALKRLPLFKYCNYQELVKALNIIRVRTYQPQQVIVEEGSEGDDLFIVLSGKVLVLKGGQPLTTLGPGAHFGEMALIDRAPRSATVRAAGSTRVMVLNRQHFYPLLRQEPRMAVKLLWSFLQSVNTRLRSTSADLMEARGELSALSREISLPLLDDDNLPWS